MIRGQGPQAAEKGSICGVLCQPQSSGVVLPAPKIAPQVSTRVTLPEVQSPFHRFFSSMYLSVPNDFLHMWLLSQGPCPSMDAVVSSRAALRPIKVFSGS